MTKFTSSLPSAKRPKISTESGSQLSLHEVHSQPSTSRQADAFEFEIDNPQEEEEFLTQGEEFPTNDIYQDVYTCKDRNIAPRIVFSKQEIPKIYNQTRVGPPSTKNANFSIQLSDNIVSLIKGIKQTHVPPPKFDIKSGDSYFNQVLSHANSKFMATEVPDDCFRIAASSRLALSFSYKQLNRQQTILKSLVLHAELIKDQFLTDDRAAAEELIKIYILPIDSQIESIQDTIRKIRMIALPRFIPASIKKTIIAAPILPDKIWNISTQIQNKIQSSRAEFYKRNTFKTSTPHRESRPFQTRGRSFDRRARPQRRGGSFRRRNEQKPEYTKNEDKAQ